ncbi:DUF5946 family protein [Afifella pfennigii]|uniref:DUF5946 family protein n=1 Tax=Afifella pfennigii TaxID=209897 RepID=UPI00146FAE66|nr:DUF5946 family protein [Afifella pfennigii]
MPRPVKQEPEVSSVACPLCGASGVGGLDGCLEIFDGVIGKEFQSPERFAVHRLTVDSYSLQHPERFMVSTKSAATHLAAMCWSLECGLSRNLPLPLKNMVDGQKSFERLEPPVPQARGEVTILDVAHIESASDYTAAVWIWARSAWDAWSTHHDQARLWIAQAKMRGGRA